MSLVASVVGLLVFLGSAQAASAWHLTSVTPTNGCPGTEVSFTGTSFSGSTSKIQWTDPSSLLFTSQETTAKVQSSTKATGIVPLFSQTEGSGIGTVAIDKSNTVPFTFNQLQNCFKGGGGGTTGPTGPTGKGTTGEKGATGPTGGGGGGGSTCSAATPEPVGGEETGTWSATMHVEVSDFQSQTQGSISFPCQLSEEQGRKLKIRYLNQVEVAAVTKRPECPGSAEQPEATPGWLCIFQGATATPGSVEGEWKNYEAPTGTTPVTFIQDGGGNKCTSPCVSPTGIPDYAVGALVVFRTNPFVENAPETKVAVATILNADGTFAVNAKE